VDTRPLRKRFAFFYLMWVIDGEMIVAQSVVKRFLNKNQVPW
jgi:hypothetical protein